MTQPRLTHDPKDRKAPRWKDENSYWSAAVEWLVVGVVFIGVTIEFGATGAAWACIGLGAGSVLAWLGFQVRGR